MKHGLWGHALLLASKMDNRTHARVMTRYSFAYCLLVWYGYLSDNKVWCFRNLDVKIMSYPYYLMQDLCFCVICVFS